ncbi:GTPase-associated system all-helical protein GASH [Paraburkholderia sp. RL17-347-BIC-D]|uniref:GTPase-associated system all-helical protein GASH n=1 Tax=Paraburkholderia sp. RL17-347-BIC-D TaxID=3031632 RepID=UPI0038B83910
MSVMAKYVRIFWPDPKDEDVHRRNAAVATIQAWISALDDSWAAIRLASALADSVADGQACDTFALKVEQAIVDAGSAAFVRDNSDLEIVVVALVSALDLVRREPDETVGAPVDALAAALWSALSFQPTILQEPIELLRQEVLVAARERTMLIAERSRKRVPVPEIGPLVLPEAQPTGSRANAVYRKATEPLVKALRENAELDREELEFLWWTIEDWSDALDGRLSDANPLVRAVVAGIDGASKLRRLPASGHRNVVLRGVPAGSAAALTALLTALEDYRSTLAKSINADRVGQSPSVFPLLAGIASGHANRSGADIERDAREWGARALLESGILQVKMLGGG